MMIRRYTLWRLYTKSKYFSLEYNYVTKWGFGSRATIAMILTCLQFYYPLITDCGPCVVYCLHHFVAIYLTKGTMKLTVARTGQFLVHVNI